MAAILSRFTPLVRKTFEKDLFISARCYPCLVQLHQNIHSSELLCGGRPKSEWRRKRVPAWTRLCLEKTEKRKTRKAYGGGRKTKVTRAKEGSYIWRSQDVEFQTPILDVLHNTAHKDFTERKIMVKGTIIEVDGEKFKAWYEAEENKDVKVSEELLDEMDGRMLQQLKRGKVLAKVSSRPGQEGKVNGYLLEGEELDAYLQQSNKPTSVQDSKA